MYQLFLAFMKQPRKLPKSLQISEALIREISAGILTDGARLPTERQMAQDYGVAIGTLRKALGILEEKGLLERVQGSGNYIRARTTVESIYRLFRLELLKGGGLPTAKILRIDLKNKPVDAPHFGGSKVAHCITRLRYLNGQVSALEQIWLDERFARNLNIFDMSESLYSYYQSSLNLIISRMEDKVSCAQMPDWTPKDFGLSAKDMAGYIERIAWDQWGDPAEFSKTWFNPHICHYVNRR